MKHWRAIRERVRSIAGWSSRLSVFAVLGYAGLMKLDQPYPTADFLDAVINVHSVPLVQGLGVAEALLALLIVSGAASLWAGRLVTVVFTMFAVTHAMAATQPDPPPSCGCLGNSEAAASVPTWAWIAGNAGLAMIGGVIAWSGEERRQPPDAPTPEITHG